MKTFLLLFFFSFYGVLAHSQSATRAIAQIESELLKKINAYRQKNGLSTLELEEGLAKSAQNQCDYLFKIGKLTHKQPDSRYKTTRIRIEFFSTKKYMIWGENCLKSYANLSNMDPKLVEEITAKQFESWRNSTPHNDNLIQQRYTHAGFGFRTNPETQEIYCVMDFAGN